MTDPTAPEVRACMCVEGVGKDGLVVLHHHPAPTVEPAPAPQRQEKAHWICPACLSPVPASGCPECAGVKPIEQPCAECGHVRHGIAVCRRDCGCRGPAERQEEAQRQEARKLAEQTAEALCMRRGIHMSHEMAIVHVLLKAHEDGRRAALSASEAEKAEREGLLKIQSIAITNLLAQATTLREALRLLRANLVGVLQEAEGVAHTNRTAAALAIEEADSALGLPEGASQDKERGE